MKTFKDYLLENEDKQILDGAKKLVKKLTDQNKSRSDILKALEVNFPSLEKSYEQLIDDANK
ncbi:MAG: hypothetical protein JHC26_00345 [Thermofilum sp.]|jgi:hypothetical protein|uniref:hypothetical protein n=1 Tax=Thermofilum sp. TaxID=1961369 RepID=UPI00258FAD3E|nr:hypothetical protein [Thermofilum sp.]MCI4407514.1 hypothetical protein [Thermofilum sp.]